MCAKLLTTLAIAISIPTSLSAQDAPPTSTPSLKIDAPASSDTDREKVRLTEGVTPTLPAPTSGETPIPALADGKPGIPKSIQKMSADEKQQLGALLRDASAYVNGIRVQEAFEKLLEAELMAPDYAIIHNLLGAAHTKTRDFDKAAIAFARAIELDPTTFISRFNLTEIRFVQGKFAESEKAFRKLLDDNPKAAEKARMLMEFKILICRLKQDDEEGAREILAEYDFLDDHPGFYFGNAAIHFNNGEDDEARTWMTSAKRVYSPQQNSLYTDSLVEVGWIEFLQ